MRWLGSPVDHRHETLATQLRAAAYDPVLTGYTDMGADPRAAPGGAADPTAHTYGSGMRGVRSIDANPGGSSAHLAASVNGWLEAEGYSVPGRAANSRGPRGPTGPLGTLSSTPWTHSR
jgi:hypothetical protein